MFLFLDTLLFILFLNKGVIQKELSSVDQAMENNVDDSLPLDDSQNLRENVPESSETSNDFDKKQSMTNGNSVDTEPGGSKRPIESEELNVNSKKIRTVIIDSDDEADIVKDKPVCNGIKVEDQSILQENNGDLGADCHPSEGQNEKFQCTACNKVVVEVHAHPLLKVIICKDCKCLMEEKMHVKVWILIMLTHTHIFFIQEEILSEDKEDKALSSREKEN